MKRLLIIVLSMLFVLGFTVSAFAVHAEVPSETQAAVAKGATQVTLGGELRFRGEARQNTTDFNSDNGDHSNSYDGRVRLNVQADTSKNTTGYVQIEAGNGVAADTYTWGSGGSGATGVYTEGNAKRGTFNLLQAWIQSKNLFGAPMGVKVGHMPVKLGNGLFLDHSKFGDDAIMVFFDPSKELHIALANAKANENTAASAGSAVVGSDDTDVYVGIFAFKGAGFNMSGDVTYLNDQDYNAEGLHFWNYGLRMDSKLGPIGFKADIELQQGISKNVVNNPSQIGTRDTKFQGHAMLAGVNVNVDPLTLDAELATGSGDGDNADDKINTFVTTLGADQHYTYVYEYRVRTAGVTAPVTGQSALGGTGTGIANTTYYKLGATMKPTKTLSVNLSAYRLKATKAVTNCECTYRSRDIGNEIDGKITVQVDKNLVYYVEGGYLMAGDFYRNLNENNPDDPYAVRHGLMLSF